MPVTPMTSPPMAVAMASVPTMAIMSALMMTAPVRTVSAVKYEREYRLDSDADAAVPI